MNKYGLPAYIDEETSRLLFLNPNLSVEMVKKIISTIFSLKGFFFLKDALQDNLNDIMNEIKQMKKDEIEGTVTLFEDKIKDWENAFNVNLSLKSILEISNITNIKMSNVLNSKLSPKAIELMLSEHVVGQESYLKNLSLSFYLHQIRSVDKVEYPRFNMLVVGPSGSGKTYSIQKLASIFNLNYVIVDCGSLVQAGIVGNSIASSFTELYIKNNNSLEAMENAIVIFDEFDKLLEDGYYNDRIMNELLRVCDEDGEILFAENYGSVVVDKLKLKTKNMLFLFTGVFASLEMFIQRKSNTINIGFNSGKKNMTRREIYEKVSLSDFQSIGIKQELLGRIGSVSTLLPLEENDYIKLLKNPNSSPVNLFIDYFKKHNIDIRFTNASYLLIAKHVSDNSLGVRGLKSFLSDLLKDEMSNLTKRKLIINSKVIKSKFKADDE